MRLWTLHPEYLDAKGLVALWREALLAQKVLQGGTKGYKHHPQLLRFSETKNPPAALASYLKAVHEESVRRGYKFDVSKIGAIAFARKNHGNARPVALRVGALETEIKKARPGKIARICKSKNSRAASAVQNHSRQSARVGKGEL